MRPISATPQIELECGEKAEIMAMKITMLMAIPIMKIAIVVVVIPIGQRRQCQGGKDGDRQQCWPKTGAFAHGAMPSAVLSDGA
jgi:hypothetical protein